ncbi:regulatory protein RecX [Schleiferiaceae bacterium]|nr:regulatory protein RecX [Schleiferiaceae bacterium]
MTTSEALQRLQRYCSYQERSPFEVDRKLQQLGLPRDRHEEVIAQLMEDSFLDEYRFTEAYTRGKLNQKQWAPRRIRMGLQEHRIPRVTIDRILRQVDQGLVDANALYLVERWFESKSKEKLTAALQRRGYDFELITSTYNTVRSQRG